MNKLCNVTQKNEKDAQGGIEKKATTTLNNDQLKTIKSIK